MKVGIYGYEDTCVKIYDPEIKGGSKLIATRDNYNTASHYLGVALGTVQKHCTRKTKLFSPSLGKYVAVRLSKKDPTEVKERIVGDIRHKKV